MDNIHSTKLIVVDGLPGSGKSTTAQWLALQLQRNRINARWLPEFEIPHPLHWFDYWDGVHYLPPDFEQTTMAEFIETSIEKWESFVVSTKRSGEVWVAESVLFQNTIGMLLLGDAQSDRLIDYARSVHKMINTLKPVLIYFYQNDIAAALHKICHLRGKGFENELIENMERFPYLKNRNLMGLPGVAALWTHNRQLTDLLFSEYTIRKLAIENSAGDWPTYRQRILDFLSLPSVADEEIVSKNDLERFVGTYGSAHNKAEQYTVKLEENGLVIYNLDAQTQQLIPISPHSFYMGGSPIIVTLSEDVAGQAQYLNIDKTRLGGSRKVDLPRFEDFPGD